MTVKRKKVAQDINSISAIKLKIEPLQIFKKKTVRPILQLYNLCRVYT